MIFYATIGGIKVDICILPLITTVIQLIIGTVWEMFFKSYESDFYITMLQIFLTTFLSIGVPAYIYLLKTKKRIFPDIASDVKPNSLLIQAFILGVSGQFAGILVNLPVNAIYLTFKPEIPQNHPDITNLKQLAVGIIAMCVTPAFFEEIFFRGIIFNHFRRFGSSAATVLSAFLFATVHYSALNFAGPFVLGLIFGIITARTHRIIYAIIAHFAVNLVALLLTYSTNFPIFESYANAVMIAAIFISVPIVIHVVNKFRELAEPLPYSEIHPIEETEESTFQTETGDTVKIIQHQPREKMIYLAFQHIFSKPCIYIILAFFIFTAFAEFMF